MYINLTGDGVKLNKTVSGVTNGTVYNLTPEKALADGNYKFNIECTDSAGTKENVSSANLDLVIDTVSPTRTNITILWGQTNNTDKAPYLSWGIITDANFERYLVRAINISSGSVFYAVNVTNQTRNYVQMNLSTGYTYNFSVIAYDLAGNYNTSVNTTDTWYYVDEVCGTLASGWNLCGATWTTPKNLSIIGNETSATFVTIWNTSHAWKTCNYAVSGSGVNCNLRVGFDEYYTPFGVTTLSNASVNVTGATLPADTYYYRVSAIFSLGEESEASNEVAMGITEDGDGNSSGLSWTAVGGASYYRIYNGTVSGGQASYFITGNLTFNHTGQLPSGLGVPLDHPKSYNTTNIVPSVWIYVNSSTEWKNRTWASKSTSANITLTNQTNGWNIITGIFRNGRKFGDLGKNFVDNLSNTQNVSMFSMPYNNGTTVPYVYKGYFALMSVNETSFDYGRAMWVYYNGTKNNTAPYGSSHTFDVGSW